MPKLKEFKPFKRKRQSVESIEVGKGGRSAYRREPSSVDIEARHNRRYRLMRLLSLLPGRPIDRVRNVARILGVKEATVRGYQTRVGAYGGISAARLRQLELELWRLFGLKLENGSIIDRGEAYIYSNLNRDGFVWNGNGDPVPFVDGDDCWDGKWSGDLADLQAKKRPKFLVLAEGLRLGNRGKRGEGLV